MQYLRRLRTWADSLPGRRAITLTVSVSFLVGGLLYRWWLLFGSPESYQAATALIGGKGLVVIVFAFYIGGGCLCAALTAWMMRKAYESAYRSPDGASPGGRGPARPSDSRRVVSIFEKKGKVGRPPQASVA